MPSTGEHTGHHYMPPSRPAWPSSVFLHPWTLKGSRWRGAWGPSLQPSPLVVLGSTFGALFSSWRKHYGAGARPERDPTLCLQTVLQPGCSHHSLLKKVDPSGSNWQICWNSQSSGQIPLPTPLVWQNSHIAE